MGRQSVTRVLGIDPGSRITGYGIIESDGMHSRHLGSGCIRTLSGTFPDRLGEIFHGIREVLLDWQPQEVAIEQVIDPIGEIVAAIIDVDVKSGVVDIGIVGIIGRAAIDRLIVVGQWRQRPFRWADWPGWQASWNRWRTSVLPPRASL